MLTVNMPYKMPNYLMMNVRVLAFECDFLNALGIDLLGHYRKPLSSICSLWFSLKLQKQPFRVTEGIHA